MTVPEIAIVLTCTVTVYVELKWLVVMNRRFEPLLGKIKSAATEIEELAVVTAGMRENIDSMGSTVAKIRGGA